MVEGDCISDCEIGYSKVYAANDYARGMETARNVAVIDLGMSFSWESILLCYYNVVIIIMFVATMVVS